ncbi:ABC transporter substrate-binding protein [Bacillus xiapuensis]|uniref:ABC transporter substrate-binding protein n=1 Tax=Bacillus xiapuensis TaxID=2014075 RepID=UPI000C24E2E2|nr:ABC transporter substrate-binding protein [Bacillus xiapuensis]
MKSYVKLLSLLSFLLLLAACGKSGDATSADGKTTEDGKTVIEYWHVNAETQGGNTVEELVKEFNEQSKTTKVVAKYNPDMYKGLMQNLQAEAAAGKSPAVVQVGWAFLDYFSSNFSYTSPQEVIDKHAPEDQSFLKDNFLNNVMDLAKNSEEKQVGIPYSLSTPVLYINKDLLKKAGLEENGPKTWQEVKEFSKVIKEKTGKYGFYMQEPADNWATQALLESNGARMLKDGKASFASKEGIEAYKLLADMVVKDKTALHVPWDQGVQSFIDGNVAMAYTTIARRSQIQENVKFKAAAIKSPAWEGKEVRLPAGGAMLAITAQEESQQKAAWEFMKYLYSVESMAKWTEGTGYVPPRKDVAEAENGLKAFLEENEMMKAAVEQMDGVVSWTSFPGNAGLQAEQLLLDIRDQILGGKTGVEEGLKSTEKEINQLLK